MGDIEIKIEVSEDYRRLMEEKLSPNGINEMMREIVTKGGLLAAKTIKEQTAVTPFKYFNKGLGGNYLTSIRSDQSSPSEAVIYPHVDYREWIEKGGNHPRWGTPTKFRGYSIVAWSAIDFIPKLQTLVERIVQEHIEE